MNTALQCLSNTLPLTQYFLLKKFIPDINNDNVLGSNGEIVFSYIKTLTTLWAKDVSSFSPNMMKRAAGKMNAMFEGF